MRRESLRGHLIYTPHGHGRMAALAACALLWMAAAGCSADGDGDHDPAAANASGQPIPMATPVADERVFTSDGDFTAEYWRRPIPPQGPVPAGRNELDGSMQPSACGTCHYQQHQDWQTAIHSAAYSPGLSGQLVNWERDRYGSVRSCLVCHAPTSEQNSRLRMDDGQYGTNPDYDASLRDQGLICAGCHMRGWQIHGPPRRDGSISVSPDGSPHDGVTRTTFFEDSRFCAGCHQFEAGSPAPNGKFLENTYVEWLESRYAAEGVTCQTCHMPDRRHLWRGIHDPEMTASGVTVDWVGLAGGETADAAGNRSAALRITNTGTGHMFPTYVTPEVLVTVELLDENRQPIPGSGARAEIARRVNYTNSGWVESSDTRITPDSAMNVTFEVLPGTRFVSGRIEVRPDAFYKSLFESLLASGQSDSSAALLSQAHRASAASPFSIFEDTVAIGP